VTGSADPPTRFDDLLAGILADPAAEAALLAHHQIRAAVLVLGYSGSAQRLAADGPAYALALARAAERAFATAFDAADARLHRRLRDGLLLVFDTPLHALTAALDGLVALDGLNRGRTGTIGDGTRSDPITAAIGLGFGDLLLDPGQDATSAEVNHTLHLAGAATSGEILATESFLAALGTPSLGVGTHRARTARISAVGLTFHEIRDYRD